jgi:hypothetical protein
MTMTSAGTRPRHRGGLVALCLAVLGGLLLTAAAQAGAAGSGQSPDSVTALPKRLSVSGAQVLDPQGRPIILRGYNWGQWGTAQPQDAPDNRAAGANSVRIPLRWWGDWRDDVDSRDPDAPGHIDPAHLDLLDQTIKWAVDKHLWVDLFVDSNFGQGSGGRMDNFWTNPAMKQQFVEVWQFLVQRYLHTPFIGSYEILPEPQPVGVDDAGVREFYESIIPVIRDIDPNTPVVVGPNHTYNLNYLDDAHTTVDPNVIYTGNYFIFDDPLARINEIVEFRQQFNAPVWINQVGIPSGKPDSLDKANTVLDAFDTNGVGWAWWTYRIASTNPDTHGIYYQNPDDPTKWIVKPEWLALVNSFLHP